MVTPKYDSYNWSSRPIVLIKKIIIIKIKIKKKKRKRKEEEEEDLPTLKILVLPLVEPLY